jgi:hypothetical protein
MCIWVSQVILTVSVGSFLEIPTESVDLDIQGKAEKILFIVGDTFFMLAGMFASYWYKGEHKMSWTLLFIGLTFSIHLPLAVRSWKYRMLGFYNNGEKDQSLLIHPIIATAGVTAVGMGLALTSFVSLDIFQHPGISWKYRLIFKTLIGLGIFFGQLYVPIGIVQYGSTHETSASTVFLFLSPILVGLGYIPGRIMMIIDYHEDEETYETLLPS